MKNVIIPLMLGLSSISHAGSEPTEPLNAQESDPITMGWMTGFPPPPTALIMPTLTPTFGFIPKPLALYLNPAITLGTMAILIT